MTRPDGGIPYSLEEQLLDDSERLDPIVARMWENYSVQEIAAVCSHELRRPVSERQVWSARQRLDKRKLWGLP